MRSPAPSRRTLRPRRRPDASSSFHPSSSEQSASLNTSADCSVSIAAATTDTASSSSVAMEVETAETEIATAPSSSTSDGGSACTSTSSKVASSDAGISMASDEADVLVTEMVIAVEAPATLEEGSTSSSSAAAPAPLSQQTVEEDSAISASGTDDALQCEESSNVEVARKISSGSGNAVDDQASRAVETADMVPELSATDGSEVEGEKEKEKDGAVILLEVPKEEEVSAVKVEGEGGIVVNLLPVKSEPEVKVERPPVPAAKSSSSPLTEGTARPVLDGKLKESVAAVPQPAPESLSRAPDSLSAIHSLRGFMDVGNASLFHPSEPWVLATAALLAKRKLSKG